MKIGYDKKFIVNYYLIMTFAYSYAKVNTVSHVVTFVLSMKMRYYLMDS